MKKSVKRESRFCKRVSRRCQEGVNSVSRTCTGGGCQEDFKRESRGFQGGVKMVSKLVSRGRFKLSRGCQDGVKRVSRGCQEDLIKNVSRGFQLSRV